MGELGDSGALHRYQHSVRCCRLSKPGCLLTKVSLVSWPLSGPRSNRESMPGAVTTDIVRLTPDADALEMLTRSSNQILLLGRVRPQAVQIWRHSLLPSLPLRQTGPSK